MAKVELEAVHKRYGDVHVVRGVTLSIEEGEFLVLVGRSGCGKSTCLRMIAGLEEISEGEIRIAGRRVNDVPPKDRDIGMVFQSYALYPHMSVRENIAFGLKLRGIPQADIDARTAEVAGVLGIGALLDRRPRELSGGQRQRVAMGRAIARRPRVFLFDEPLSNLDAALRVQMRAELAALHEKLGSTMVYVTHDQVEAMTLADRIAVMEGGVLQQVAPPLALFHAPANRFVAGFIGSPAMNFLEGRVESGAFVAPGVKLALADAPAGAAALGVRPHDLALAGERGAGAPLARSATGGGTPTERGQSSGISGAIEVVEPMGWEAYVHVRTDAGRVVARLEGAQAAAAKIGDRVTLAVDPRRIHLFAADGKTLRSPAAEVSAAPAAARA